MLFADNFFVAWSTKDQPNQPTLFAPTITISEQMYLQMKNGVPVDMRALDVLRRQGSGGLAIDIYMWLAYRMNYLSRPTLVPWLALSNQFGGQYARLRAFKAHFLKQLPFVELAYPGLNIVVQENGLLLIPSARAVPKKFPKAAKLLEPPTSKQLPIEPVKTLVSPENAATWPGKIKRHYLRRLGLPGALFGDCWFSTYFLIISRGAPPQETAA